MTPRIVRFRRLTMLALVGLFLEFALGHEAIGDRL